MRNFTKHYQELSSYFESENLISLTDNNHNYRGMNTMDLLHLEYVNTTFPKFNKFKALRDIKNCNNDLKLFTAHLYLYRPDINNPLEEFKFFKDHKVFTYFQNGPDWFYSSHVSVCYEKLYNFWDRIGDTLAYYLNLDIKPFNVGFASAIDKMAQSGKYNASEAFQYLLNFRQNEFKEFNKHRIGVVHYYQFETTYRDHFEANMDNESEIKKIWKWKYDMPEYFKEHLLKSCDGYFHMLTLLKQNIVE